MSICSYNTNLTCYTINCNSYSVTGCMPLNLIDESCFTSQYCERFTGCTLLNEFYSEYQTDYTCYNTTYTSTTNVSNNSIALTPKLFIFVLILQLSFYLI
jgi:hypothetical protein